SVRTRTPIVKNGNNTYRLTHTRFAILPGPSESTSESTGSSLPETALSTQPTKISPNLSAITTSTAEMGPSSLKSPGFSRDQTIGNQVRQAIGGAPWDKKVILKIFQVLT